MKSCSACGKGVEIQGKVGRQEVCPHCGGDLHCCLNCLFHDEDAQNQCRESSAEWVSDREKNNFCDFFVFRDRGGSGSLQKKEETRAKLEALFKKRPS